MPNIIVNEYDNTSNGLTSLPAHTVVVPGFVSAACDTSIFDANGICEFTSKIDFKNKIGVVDYNGATVNTQVYIKVEDTVEGKSVTKYYPAYSDVTGETPVTYSATGKAEHYGNQIAYELLGMGYTVLYKKLSEVKFYIDKAETDVEIKDSDGKEVIAYQIVDEGSALTDRLKAGTLEPSDDAFNLLGEDNFWEPLQDKANYTFRFVIHGLLNGGTRSTDGDKTDIVVKANKAITKLAAYIKGDTNSRRGDCTALLDLSEDNIYNDTAKQSQASLITAIREEINNNYETMDADGKYAEFVLPSVIYEKVDSNDIGYSNKHFPASFHYLACFAKSVQNGNPEWFAIAGKERGLCKYKVASTTVKLGEVAMNALEPRFIVKGEEDKTIHRACNVIMPIKGTYYLWGNRTAYTLQTDGGLVASHFLNIRQLCTTLKQVIYDACMSCAFDPNSDVLRVNYRNKIIPTLEKMKSNQGIIDYRFIAVETKVKGVLKDKLRIIPIEAVEDFEIDVYLEDTFGTVSASVEE